MPSIDDVLHRLQGAMVYTTVDWFNRFFHVPMEEKSSKYTSFVTRNGRFEFLFVPFGISHSPAVFYRYIAVVVGELIEAEIVFAYMDVLVISAKDEEEGLSKLKTVLRIVQVKGLKVRLKVKWSKCQFLKRCSDFLGYTIENGTIKPAELKTRATCHFPVAATKKSLQQFRGLAYYFDRFIESYATIAVTTVRTDASVYSYGSVLMQRDFDDR